MSIASTELHVVQRPLSELIEDVANANTHPKRSLDAIKDSLKRFGQVEPLVIRKGTNVVIGGNGRLVAMRELGWETCWVHEFEGSDAEAMALAITLNRSAQHAEWNNELLAEQLLDLHEEGFELDELGWTEEEVNNLVPLPDIEVEDIEPKIDQADQLAGQWNTAAGQLWIIEGKQTHRLLCGDSIDVKNVARLMDGETASLLATDPPYGVDFKGGRYNPHAKKWEGIENDGGENLEAFLSSVLCTWLPSIDKQSAFYLWVPAMQEGQAAAAIVSAGLHIQSQIIWNKSQLVLGQADYHWKHENCWYAFWKGERHRWYGERNKTTVWDIQKLAHSSYTHPMQKPCELYAIPMRHHTRPGDIVAEPFAGSGSQFDAAEQLSRRCYGMEISPKYCAVILQRMQDAGCTCTLEN